MKYRSSLQSEVQRSHQIMEFKEYLVNFTNPLDSPRRNSGEYASFPIKSQGSNEGTMVTEEEEKSSCKLGEENNSKKKISMARKSDPKYEMISPYQHGKSSHPNLATLNTEESEEHRTNQLLKLKIKELVIEVEALKTTIQAQDSHGLKGTADEKQGLISSNEALSDLLKKKSQIVDNLSQDVAVLTAENKVLKENYKEYTSLKRN